MPMWTPPTPPHDDNDIYIDQSLCFLYEHNTMPETQLPPIYIKKEHKKPKIESITTRKQKQRKEEQPRVPRSLFDRPTSAMLKLRREAKLKQGLLKPFRPVPQLLNKPPDPTPDHPEWLIHEDWALLQLNFAVGMTKCLPDMMTRVKSNVDDRIKKVLSNLSGHLISDDKETEGYRVLGNNKKKTTHSN